jgi:NAD(P)-dependent dehydrogenase (short-subunit alcohol dehydrogenase family)
MSLPIQSILDFKDQSVIVTGSSGGIGPYIAHWFAEAGANVIVHYHSNRSDAERCANSIQELGRDATAVKTNLG